MTASSGSDGRAALTVRSDATLRVQAATWWPDMGVSREGEFMALIASFQRG